MMLYIGIPYIPHTIVRASVIQYSHLDDVADEHNIGTCEACEDVRLGAVAIGSSLALICGVRGQQGFPTSRFARPVLQMA